MAKSERTIALRSQIQQARVQLAYFARNRCTSVRAELQEDASKHDAASAAGVRGATSRTRIGEVVDEVDAGITAHLGDVATELDLTAPDRRRHCLRPRSRRRR